MTQQDCKTWMRARKVVQQWMSLDTAFSWWSQQARKRRRLVGATTRVLQRWTHQVQAEAFSRWEGMFAECRRLRAASQRVVQRWTRLELSKPWWVWHERAVEQKRLRYAAERTLGLQPGG